MGAVPAVRCRSRLLLLRLQFFDLLQGRRQCDDVDENSRRKVQNVVTDSFAPSRKSFGNMAVALRATGSLRKRGVRAKLIHRVAAPVSRALTPQSFGKLMTRPLLGLSGVPAYQCVKGCSGGSAEITTIICWFQ